MTFVDAMQTKKPFREKGGKTDIIFQSNGERVFYHFGKGKPLPMVVVLSELLLKDYELVDE